MANGYFGLDTDVIIANSKRALRYNILPYFFDNGVVMGVKKRGMPACLN
jgi:hypothetical protein